jgi:hypothetical protein
MRFMKFALAIGLLGLGLAVASSASTVSPWVPIFKGVDEATGTNNQGTVQLSVHAVRVDLLDPDVRLFVTPPVTNNYVTNQRETLLQTPREFLNEHRLQVAVNCAYFAPAGYTSPSGTPAWIDGLAISQGRLVSAQTSPNNALSAILFATNNQPTFVYSNWPPVDTTGVFNAFPGMYPLLSNGVNISYAYTNSSDSVHFRQPRTGCALSEDNRYLIMITIDGRQQDFSDGALDWETAEFLLLFGAWQAMNMDGGGSTCMVKANDCGQSVDINQNSFQFAVGRLGSQRPVGCNFGVYAPTLLPIKDLTVVPGGTTAIVTWRTDVPTTTQVQYGLTSEYGNTTPLDSRPRRLHVATLSSLIPGSNYYYRAVSTTATEQYILGCQFSNTISLSSTELFPLTNSWKFTTNNLDGTTWKARDYADSEWLGEGPALLYVENSAFVAPKNTALPPPIGQPIPRTYYFRSHFNFTGGTPTSLVFSNYIDDGAVFYLNGAELYRLRMPSAPTVITNNTAANGSPCTGTLQAGDAATNCPDVFVISGNLLTNLVQGTNVMAVEVHNGAAGGDLVFGSALIQVVPAAVVPRLNLWMEDNTVTLFWNGEGFRLQRSPDVSSGNWADLPGPLLQSPVTLTNSGTAFYRLTN